MNLPTNTFELLRLTEQFSSFVGAPVFVTAGGFCADSSPYEQERAIVTKAVASRQVEFYSGRHYAREALRKAGCMPLMILRAEKGNPVWPEGFSGSISHDQQHVIVVTHAANVKGIGIDLILDSASVEPHLQSLITTESELKFLAQALPDITSVALAFGLKESVVKAISPNIDHYVDLLDIHLTLNGSNIVASLPKLGAQLACSIIPLGSGFVALSVLL